MQSVLIVEDNIDIAHVVQLFLESNGYMVHLAERADEATKLLRANSYCAIIMDYHVDGFSALSFVRDAHKAGVTVVLISGVSDVNEKKRELGVSHALAKPFEPDELLEVLKEICA